MGEGGGGRRQGEGNGGKHAAEQRERGGEGGSERARDAYRDQRTKICLHFHTETNDARAFCVPQLFAS